MEEKQLITQEEEDPRKIFRVLKKKCLQCAYLVPWEENVNKCHTNPECPAVEFRIVKGSDPNLLADMLTGLITGEYSIEIPLDASPEEVKKAEMDFNTMKEKLLNKIMKRDDALEILQKVYGTAPSEKAPDTENVPT